MQLILAPQLNPNEDSIYVVEWRKGVRDPVRRGEIIAEVETSKATVEVESEADGYLIPLVEAGKAVRVGEPLAALVANVDEQFVLPDLLSRGTTEASQSSADKRRRWTVKAKLLAERNGLNPETVEIPVEGPGPVTEALVQEYLQQRVSSPSSSLTISFAPAKLAGPQEDLVDSHCPAGRAERILILGAGDGAVQTLDVIRLTRHQLAIGLLDDNSDIHGRTLLGCPIVGPLSLAKELWGQGVFDKAIVSISTNPELRVDLYTQLTSQGIPFANVVDPTVIIGSNASMGSGNLIMAFCRLGSCATIGDNNFLSAYVNIEHHSILGNHCTFGPGVMLSSRVRIGNRVRLGTGIFMEPKVSIEDDAVIGSGNILVYGSRVSRGRTIRTPAPSAAAGRHAME